MQAGASVRVMDKATEHMAGLLRTLAAELEAGNGLALESKIDMPRGSGWHGDTQYVRTYTFSLTIAQPNPENAG